VEFGGKTLDDLREEIDKLKSVSDETIKAKANGTAAIKMRSDAERNAMKLSKHLALAMKSHPAYGEDSVLVHTSGFVTESERRSGLVRSKTPVAS